jgi:hypothetical protein
MAGLVSIVIAVPVGIGCSMAAWWIIFHAFKPHLRWDDVIEGVPSDTHSGEVMHSLGLENVGRRAAVETRVHARLRIRGLVEQRPQRWVVLEIPTNNELIPRVAPRRHGGVRHVIVLLPRLISDGDLERLPPAIRSAIRSGEAGLPELMSLRIESDITLSAICSDEFSGARHVTQSRPLHAGDLAAPMQKMSNGAALQRPDSSARAQ